MANKKISELPYIPESQISGNTLVPLVTYYSAATGDTVHTYVSDLQDYLNNNGYWISGNSGSGSIVANNGGGNDATGNFSLAQGTSTLAQGIASHSEGRSTTTTGNYSHAEGFGSTSEGFASHSEGYATISLGDYSHSEGYATISLGDYSHSSGYHTIAGGNYSHAGGSGVGVGDEIIASGETSFVHFNKTINGIIGAFGDYSAILGGADHKIETGSTSSAILGGSGNTISPDVLNTIILGGSGKTATDSNTVYVPKLNIGSIESGTSITNLGIDSTGKVISGSSENYKVYTALLTQSATSIPTATILKNTLGYTPSLSYGSTGTYKINLSANTPNLYYSITTNSTNRNLDFRVTVQTSMGIYDIGVVTYSGGSLTNSLLLDTPVEVRIYN